jgi:hypothetical protein
MNKDIHNSLATNKSITKQDVDSEYYAWLNTVDRGLTEFKKMPPKPTPTPNQ